MAGSGAVVRWGKRRFDRIGGRRLDLWALGQFDVESR